MIIDSTVTLADLRAPLAAFWPVSGAKIANLCATWEPANGSPVFTVRGRYTSRGWTEWTQGFQFGWAILQFDATGDARFLELGRRGTLKHMALHVSHVGVHDHGFNNISTYGNLWRLAVEGRIARDPWELAFYELALKTSGAVQAARWRPTHQGPGYIYSFNGPQSLFADTIRSVRVLLLAHQLGHVLMGENDERISLLGRGIEHAETTARWNVFYGEGRDTYDQWGRVAHESLFNVNDGRYRAPSTQQGYSPFSTWTRGLAWVMAGYPEQLEYLDTVGTTSSTHSEVARRSRTCSCGQPGRHATSTSTTRRPTASRTGTRVRLAWPTCRAGATGARTRSITTSRSTARPPRSARKGSCASGDGSPLGGTLTGSATPWPASRPSEPCSRSPT
jgi:unsaturated chondroitin disaccharide hydrolase